MLHSETVKTTCNRDCPDACGMLVSVVDGRAVGLRGDPDHPVTRGFLCYRTNHFLARQYHPERLVAPLLRRGDRQVRIPLDEALDIAAERLRSIRDTSGPAAIFHYRSGGSLGLLTTLTDYFFETFGPVTTKVGDICSGAGDAAQLTDFGFEESHDLFDLLNARHIINWGKNVQVSGIHLLPILDQARRAGARVVLIDPVHTESVRHADRYLQVRPGGDLALALAVGRLLFESGRVSTPALERCDQVAAFRGLCFARPMTELLHECDLPAAAVELLAECLADGPTAILVGWGMQRRLRGSATVRALDALAAISGNLGRAGGGVSFYFARRRAFDLRFMGRRPPPRVVREPLFAADVQACAEPPIRCIWVTAGNPVAMLPDSGAVARVFEQVEWSVVVDTHPTDTTRRASLVLPTTTLLEDDDVLGAYGHHWVGESRPAVPPPPGVLTDLQIMQELAKRLGLGDALAGSAAEWKRRLLHGSGVDLSMLANGAVRNPRAESVLFAGGVVPTQSGRVQLLDRLPPSEVAADAVEAEFPLHMLSNSTRSSQSSQWVGSAEEPSTVLVHPRAVGALADGAVARLTSRIGSMRVRLRHDPRQRTDVVVVAKGGHYDRGQAANALIEARATDAGLCAAYQDARVRIEPWERRPPTLA